MEIKHLITPPSSERLVLERVEVFSDFAGFNSTNRDPCVDNLIIYVVVLLQP